MKKTLVILGVLLILGLLAYPKVSDYLKASEQQGTSAQFTEAPLEVNVYIVKHDTIDNNINITGSLRANEEIDLTSESAGLIEKIYFNEGQDVKKGDLLVKINDSELAANLTRANFRLNLAEDREKRQEQLLEKGGISQEEYDATLNEVNVLRAEVALIKAQVAKTEIVAPFDGKIGLKYVSEGGYVTPSSRVASLQSIDPIKIDFSVPERYASQLQNGSKILYTVQGIDKNIEGVVYAKEPRIDTDTRTLNARAQSPNSDGNLLPGAFANIQLTLDTFYNALMVPTISLVPELNGQKVYMIKNGVIQSLSVNTGLRGDQKIQLIDGVAPGDTVLTTGLLQVRPGMEVKVANVEVY